MRSLISKSRDSLGQRPAWQTTLYAALATFAVYTCMYGYRKAFAAAPYSKVDFLGISYKVWLVSSQVIGYMMSKFYGIKFIAENSRKKRAITILVLIGAAWAALLLFALVPAPYNIVFMFANGFPLGMIWGLVFSFVEGRRTTEFMGAVLASSFIFASGLAKSAGAWLMQDVGINEWWMPFATGALYFVPLIIFTLALEAIPNPTADDIAQRTVRLPMNRESRRMFVNTFWPGLVLLMVAYVLLTILRDFRDNFAPELLAEAGLAGGSAIFSKTETPVALLVLGMVSLLMLVRNNYRAFMLNHIIILAGLLLAGVGTLLYATGAISGFAWFLATGSGLYIGYIPINCFYFDRMIATYRVAANVGFVMYLADSFGYLGSVAVTLVKGFVGLHISWVQFFSIALYVSVGVGFLCVAGAMLYYHRKFKTKIDQEKCCNNLPS
jgi:MFS family permease